MSPGFSCRRGIGSAHVFTNREGVVGPSLLLLVSASGLLLLVARDTAAMNVLLAIHLGVALALFLTLPYRKFAHGIYRCAALLKETVEKRNPPKLQIGND
jgi:citrate/tricarballylate utilization protein